MIRQRCGHRQPQSWPCQCHRVKNTHVCLTILPVFCRFDETGKGTGIHELTRRDLRCTIRLSEYQNFVLAVFAANFVRWAQSWVRSRVQESNRRFDQTLDSPKRLVRVAANSRATVLRSEDRVSVHFSPLSSLGGVVITMSARTFSLISQNEQFAHF